MNIIETLGFKKRGAAKQTESVKNTQTIDRELINFSDKHPREEKETRIYNNILLNEIGAAINPGRATRHPLAYERMGPSFTEPGAQGKLQCRKSEGSLTDSGSDRRWHRRRLV